MLNWLSLAVLLGAMGTSGYYRWQARRGSETIARRREGGLFLAVRALIAIPLFFVVIANGAFADRMRWASMALPIWLRWLGAGVGVLTIPAVSWVLGSLGRNVSETVLTKDRHELVTWGPYQWVRHPLYTTGITLFLAIGLMQASWVVLLLAVIVTFMIRLVVIPIEERHLLAKFGDRYRAYMSRTGRLLPRMR